MSPGQARVPEQARVLARGQVPALEQQVPGQALRVLARLAPRVQPVPRVRRPGVSAPRQAWVPPSRWAPPLPAPWRLAPP
ncbi:hypothetical protein ACFSM3_00495 [Halomonas beimenensis]|uniref:hypothetical protein n=1 Tax=Halomonas beimenensis TaxID=475662 RepID=UPI0031D28C8A